MAATLLGSLLVSLGLDSAKFTEGLTAAERQLKASQRRIEAVGKGMVNLGGRLSVAVSAPLVALGASSVKAAMESQDAIAQVNASLASMGDAAGRTSEQLQKLASGQMRKSLYDDDEILRSVTANLLTFGNVAGEQFDRAQQAALDLSAKLGTGLQASAILVGKALNDPVKGLNALKRAGVQFTDQQKEQITSMVAAGETAKAQGVILDELSKQFAGSAEAARKADPFAVMKQSFDEFQEQVGGELLKAMPAITGAITALLEAFNSLSPGMQKLVVIGGVLVAALGPVLIVLGSLTTAAAPLIASLAGIASAAAFAAGGWGALAVAMAPVLIPIAALVAAGALIYANWDKISPVLKEFWTTVQEALGPPLREIIATVSAAFKEFWEGPLGEGVRVAISVLAQLQAAYGKVLGSALLVVIKGALQAFSELVKAIGSAVSFISKLLKGDLAGAAKAALEIFNFLSHGALKVIAGMVQGITTWIKGKLGDVLNWLAAKLKWAGDLFFQLYDRVVGNSYIPDMVDGIADHMKRLDTVMVKQAEKATSKTKEAFRKLAEELAPILDRLFPENAARNAFNSDFGTIEKAVKGGALSKDASRAALDRLQDEFIAGLPEPAIPEIVLRFESDDALHSIEGINLALEDLAAQTVPTQSRMEQLFASIDTSSREVFEGLGRELSAAILGFQSLGDAIRNVVARLADRAMNALFNAAFASIGIPGFAKGTNFAPGGLAVVGEKGPELVNLPRGSQVISNDNLKGMGRSEIHKPTFVFPGITNAREAREAAGQAARRYRQELNPMRAM